LALQADPDTAGALQSEVSRIINEATIHYLPLKYNYNEDLLDKLDQIELRLNKKQNAPTARLLPKLDESEELDHFRECVHRWESSTGKRLRAAIDPLKAEVAARTPGVPYHPEFQKKFSAEFDDFIKIEVAEARERRNREIHQKTEAIFDKYRQEHPDVVAHFRKLIDSPPYDLHNGDQMGTATSSRPNPVKH
jgi:hypothetical protein